MPYCKFHPLIDAKYNCANCEVDYCVDCCDEPKDQHAEDISYKCFVCGNSLEQIGNETNIVPFWREFNNIYRYPTSLSALAVILIGASLVSVVSFWLVTFFTTICVIHYCFACLRHTAQGNLRAPGFNESFEGSIAPIFFVFLVFMIAGFFIGLISYLLGIGFGTIAWLAFVIAIPACILLIAVEEKLSPALNPSRLTGIISATGSSYFVMIVFILVMTSSVGVLNSLFDSQSTSVIGVFFQTAISIYYAIVIFHIMGYLVYQNGPKLGFSLDSKKQIETIRSEDKRLNAQIEVLVKAGAYKKAIELSVQQVKSPNANLWHWKRCFKLLQTSQSNKQLEAFSHAYLEKLDSLDQADDLAETYTAIKKRLSSFEVKSPDLQIKIADELLQIGKYKYVVLILRKLHTITKDKKPLAESFRLLSQAYTKIPGGESKALLYKQQHARIVGAS